MVVAPKGEFGAEVPISGLLEEKAELIEGARNPVGHEDADNKDYSRKKQLNENQDLDHVGAVFLKMRCRGTIGVSRGEREEGLVQVVNNQGINRTESKDPRDHIKREFELEIFIYDEDPT